jgi:uncharacterized protein (TIGR00369 family)
MEEFETQNSTFENDVRANFTQQRVMHLLGATLTRVEPGITEITLPYREDLTQQNGFIHAGIITTVADSACGYAAYTLMPAGSGVLSVEFKVNLLRPAAGESFAARARVLKPGKSLTVVQCSVYAQLTGSEKIVAAMLATMICR